MADAVRRALVLCEQSQEIRIGGDFRVGVFGRPSECGPNHQSLSCWPSRVEGLGEVVRIADLVAALALLDELAGRIQEGLGPLPVDPEVLAQISARVPAPR
jgi:hypothetical protein